MNYQAMAGHPLGETFDALQRLRKQLPPVALFDARPEVCTT